MNFTFALFKTRVELFKTNNMFLKMASSKYFEQMQPPFNNGKI
jgi:hypothetical protein